MTENQKVIGSEWFTEHGGKCIGIVLLEDKYNGLKAYIGTALGNNQKADEIRIAERGAKFPVEMAKELISKRQQELKELKELLMSTFDTLDQ